MMMDNRSASSWTLTSLIAAFSSSPWRAGLFPVSFMDRPKSMMTHVPSVFTRTFRLFRSLWETAGLYKSGWRGEKGGKGWQRIRGSGEDTRQKKWANLLFIKHLSRYSTPRIPCFPRHDTLKPDIQILWHLQKHDNIQKIPSYSFPFPSLLNVQ